MICIDTTVLIDEFRARGNRDAPVNRALLTHGAEILIVPAIAAGEFLDGAAMVSVIFNHRNRPAKEPDRTKKLRFLLSIHFPADDLICWICSAVRPALSRPLSAAAASVACHFR